MEVFGNINGRRHRMWRQWAWRSSAEGGVATWRNKRWRVV